MIEVFKEFTFEAAHSLPFLPEGHKCRKVHGHSYHVTVYAKCCRRHLDNGMVVDYADISKAWESLFAQLDHKFINDVPGLEVSTSEHLAAWIFKRMKAAIPRVNKVAVRETATAGSTYVSE